MDVSQHWKTTVDTLQDGLLVVDPQGNILAANKAAERVTGYGTDELIGKSCRLLNCTGCKLLGASVPDKFCQLFVTENVKEMPDYQQRASVCPCPEECKSIER